MGSQTLWVRARNEQGLEAGADREADLSLPKTREDKKKRVWLSQGLKQEGIIALWAKKPKTTEPKGKSKARRGAKGRVGKAARVRPADLQRGSKTGSEARAGSPGRNQKQNRDSQLQPRDTSNGQEQLEVFPHLTAGWGKPPRAPQAAARQGRLPGLCTPGAPRKPPAEPGRPAPGQSCSGIAHRWTAEGF